MFKNTEDKLLTLHDIDKIEEKAKTYSSKKQNTVMHMTHLIRKCCEQDPEKRPNIATVKDYFNKVVELWKTGESFDSKIRLPKKTLWDYCKKYKKTTAITAAILTLIISVGVFNVYIDHLTNRYTIQIQSENKHEKSAAVIWLSENSVYRFTDWKKIPLIENLDISYLNFSKCNFYGIRVSQLQANGSNLAEANFESAFILESHLQLANLQKAILKKANINNSNFTGTDFTNACLVGAHLRKSIFDMEYYNAYTNAHNFKGADFTNADLTYSTFRGINLYGVKLEGAVLQWCIFEKANLQGVNLRKADLTDANLVQANLTGADLTGANLTRAYLQGTILYKTQLPIDFKVRSLTNIKLLPISTMKEIKQKNQNIMEWWSPDTDKHSEEYFSKELNKLGLSLEEVMDTSFTGQTFYGGQEDIVRQIRPDLFLN